MTRAIALYVISQLPDPADGAAPRLDPGPVW